MINIHIPEPEYPSKEEKIIFLEKEAERMRNNPTEGEILFKRFCDKYNIRYKDQVPVIVGYKGFIIDFVITTTKNSKYKKSKKRKIAIEIDGEYHNTKEQKEKDTARTKTLHTAAYSVFRLTNEEVKSEDTIIQKLIDFLPTIKETELLSFITKIKENRQPQQKPIYNLSTQHEDLSKLLKYKDDEIDYYRKRYEEIKKHYEELQEWADQMRTTIGNLVKKEPPHRNIVFF